MMEAYVLGVSWKPLKLPPTIILFKLSAFTAFTVELANGFHDCNTPEVLVDAR